MVRFRRAAGSNLRTLARHMRAVNGGVLVLSSTVLSQVNLQHLLQRTTCPILLVR